MKRWLLVAWGALSLAAASASLAQSPVQLLSVRCWSGPQSTRVVFDFSALVAYVAPDSGRSKSLVVSIPSAGLALAAGASPRVALGDTVVDSARVVLTAGAAQLMVDFRTITSFRVFALVGGEDHPYRIVVDATRPGGEMREERRLEGIARLKQGRTRVVAVDAGHGGEDPGARGPKGVRVLEKDVTLAVSRALVDELNRLSGVRGVLTRQGDYFVPLRERYRSAEKMNADVFISVHANSSPKWRRYDRGTEVYFLSLRGASDQGAKDLADRENAADLVGGVPAQSEDDLVSILYDVKRTSTLQQSQVLAENILDYVAADRRLESRGVKQAAFAVLKSVEFPSVLVETAFINNPAEARLLKDKNFQRQIAKQIAGGVKAYFGRLGVNLEEPGAGVLHGN